MMNNFRRKRPIPHLLNPVIGNLLIFFSIFTMGVQLYTFKSLEAIMVEDGEIYIFVDQTYYSREFGMSNDGINWTETTALSDEHKRALYDRANRQEIYIDCVPPEEATCYRIDPTHSEFPPSGVEVSQDGGASWQTAWTPPKDRAEFMRRINFTTPSDIVAIDPTQFGGNDLLVAVKEAGLLIHNVDGSWVFQSTLNTNSGFNGLYIDYRFNDTLNLPLQFFLITLATVFAGMFLLRKYAFSKKPVRLLLIFYWPLTIGFFAIGYLFYYSFGLNSYAIVIGLILLLIIGASIIIWSNTVRSLPENLGSVVLSYMLGLAILFSIVTWPVLQRLINGWIRGDIASYVWIRLAWLTAGLILLANFYFTVRHVDKRFGKLWGKSAVSPPNITLQPAPKEQTILKTLYIEDDA